jgi:hypothetical protein
MIVWFFAGSRLKAESIEIVTISLTAIFTSFSYDIAIKRLPMAEVQYRRLREKGVGCVEVGAIRRVISPTIHLTTMLFFT